MDSEPEKKVFPYLSPTKTNPSSSYSHLNGSNLPLPPMPVLIPGPKARLSTGEKLNRISVLRNHPLLARHIPGTDPDFEPGDLVWAKEPGEIYWPGYISLLEDEVTPGSSKHLGGHSIYVVYLEPQFRVSIVSFTRLIRVDILNLNFQKDLIEELNRLEKSTKKKTTGKGFQDALKFLDLFIDFEPSQRKLKAVEIFEEYFLAKRAAAAQNKAKRAKLELPNADGEIIIANDQEEEASSTISSSESTATTSTSKSKKSSITPPPPLNRRKSTYGLREKIKTIQKWDSSAALSAPQTLSKVSSQLQKPKSPSSVSGKSDSGSSTGTGSSVSNSELRRKLSEDELREYTNDFYKEMDTQYKFDTCQPLKCSECREEFGEEEVVYCHDYPFHKGCLEYYPVKKAKTKENGTAESSGSESRKNGISSPDDLESDPSSSSDLDLPSSSNSTELVLKCKDCGGQRCFICKKDNENPAAPPPKCSRCDLRFHRDCLAFKWPMSEVIGSKYPITCPLHFCHVCKAEHKNCGKVRNYKLAVSKAVRCLYCMATYHKGSCVPAGCGQSLMQNNFMICPRHYGKDSKVVKKQKLFGCTLCSKKLLKSDKTISCSICPLMFHFHCVHGDWDLKDVSEEVMQNLSKTFECEACVVGNFPLYGQVVWFQQPGSIFWPGMILYPRESDQREAKGVGMFAVRYCGYPTQYYNHGHTYQALPFEIATQDFLTRIGLYLNKRVGPASDEASHLIKLSETRREELLPPPEPIYRKIERNLIRDANPLLTNSSARGNGRGRVNKKPANGKEDHEDCNCGQKSKSGDVCTYGSGCYNRAVSVECNDKNCTGGARCRNRMFSTKSDQIEDALECFISSTSKGWGLRTTKELKAGTFVVEYVGEVISKEEHEWRILRKLPDDPLYFLEIDATSFIDAEYYGNLSRLINHSCLPNCHTEKYHSAYGKPVIGIFASRDIKAGEELTFDYNYGAEAKFTFKCRCKNEGCKGYIGRARGDKENEKPGNAATDDPQSNSDWKWEDECSQCGMRGELLMCDFPGCSKAYHHRCIQLASTPKGNWFCPLHPRDQKKPFPPRRIRKSVKVPKIPISPEPESMDSESISS